MGGRIPGASVDCYNDSTNHSALSERAARFALLRRVRDSVAGGLATARRRRNSAICRRRVAGIGREPLRMFRVVYSLGIAAPHLQRGADEEARFGSAVAFLSWGRIDRAERTMR